MPAPSLLSVYQSASHVMYSMPDLTVCGLSTSPLSTCAAKMLPVVESSQPGTTMGRFFSAAATSHESRGSIW